MSEQLLVTEYNPQMWLKRISDRIERGPFKGYLEVKLNPSGVPYLNAICSPMQYDNRERAYMGVYLELDEIEHQAWLDFKNKKLVSHRR